MGRATDTAGGTAGSRVRGGRTRLRPSVAVLLALGAAVTVLAGQTAAAPAALPTISILDAVTPEGALDTVHAIAVPISLSEASASVVSVDWKTDDGTARGNDPDRDYYSASGTAAFAPGQTATSIDVLIDGGAGPEADETFTITLSNPVNATVQRGISTVTITNDDVPPPPDSGEVNVIPLGGGKQCVAIKGGGGCRLLEFGEQIPIEEIAYINPRGGKVTVHSIVGIGTFYGGRFNVKEINSPRSRSISSAQAKPILVVKLVGGSFKSCKKGNRSLSGAEAKKPVRRLWGKGKGRFRTRGRYASGSVRGTNWLTVDYCDGTRIRVVSGIVQVYDLVLKRWVVLKPGQSYTATPKKKR